jgi:3-isopropylmalate/(R)-2-methylmalate dehydratase small subunit
VNWIFRGRVLYKFGDHFNADTATEYPRYAQASSEDLAKICMAMYDPEFPLRARRGDILVAGRNYGYGHPHAQDIRAYKVLGISAIIAESFSRGWLRKAIDAAFPCLTCPDVSRRVKQGDEIEVDFIKSSINNLTTGELIQTDPFAQIYKDIIDADGLIGYLRMKVMSGNFTGRQTTP